jgi:hypothetical protein
MTQASLIQFQACKGLHSSRRQITARGVRCQWQASMVGVHICTVSFSSALVLSTFSITQHAISHHKGTRILTPLDEEFEPSFSRVLTGFRSVYSTYTRDSRYSQRILSLRNVCSGAQCLPFVNVKKVSTIPQHVKPMTDLLISEATTEHPLQYRRPFRVRDCVRSQS